MSYCKAPPMACQYPKCSCGVSAAVKCERCGTEYFEPLTDCDWCPGVKPQPVETEQA